MSWANCPWLSVEVDSIDEEIDEEDCPLDAGRFKILAIMYELLLCGCRISPGAVSNSCLFFNNLLMELREGVLSLLHRLSWTRRSRISQENRPGFSFLYSMILCAIRGVITRGRPALSPPAWIEPVLRYLDNNLLMQPWVIRKRRLMSQGRIPWRANARISCRISFGSGLPLI